MPYHNSSRRLGRGLVAAGLAAAALATASGTPAGAATSALCGPYADVTSQAQTSNHLLGVTLQRRTCDDGHHFRAKVHNYSPNAVGNRAYGLKVCSTGLTFTPYVVYIPSGGDAYPPGENGQGQPIAGVIYRPRTSTSDPWVVEVQTPEAARIGRPTGAVGPGPVRRTCRRPPAARRSSRPCGAPTCYMPLRAR